MNETLTRTEAQWQEQKDRAEKFLSLLNAIKSEVSRLSFTLSDADEETYIHLERMQHILTHFEIPS